MCSSDLHRGVVGAGGAALAANILQEQQGGEGEPVPAMKDGGSIIDKALGVISKLRGK